MVLTKPIPQKNVTYVDEKCHHILCDKSNNTFNNSVILVACNDPMLYYNALNVMERENHELLHLLKGIGVSS